MTAQVIPFAQRDIETDLLDLNKHLIGKPGDTFGLTFDGEPSPEIGLYPRDLLIVDRSLAPRIGDVVITLRAGDYIVKPYAGGKVWGVVTHVIHTLRAPELNFN